MERFAYRFEDEELAHILRGWPAGVAAALCMSSSGQTRIALYNMCSDIGSDALKRIEAVTGWASGSYAVSPKVPGVRTIRVTFSEAQDFLRIIEGVDGLTELARSFCRELEVRRAADHAQVDVVTSPDRVSVMGGSLAPRTEALGRNAAPLYHDETFRQQAPKGLFTKPSASASRARWTPRISINCLDEGMPLGFREARYFAEGPAAVVPAEIRTSGARVRVLIQPDAIEPRDLPVRAQSVGHSDDMRCFVFGPRCLESWEPGRGMIVDAGMDAFPRALVERFRGGGCRAEVSITPEGIFVTPAAPQEPRLVAPVRTAKPRALGQGLAVKLGVTTFVVAGVISGGVTALQSAVSPEDRSLGYEAAEGNSAFNVVRSIADGMVGPSKD